MRLRKLMATALAILMLSGVLLSACDTRTEKYVKSVALKQGTYKTEYTKGETLDFDALKLTLTYTDDSEEDIGADQFTVNKSFVNTAISGNYTLRATYTDPVNGIEHTDSVAIKVNEPPADPTKFVESIAFKAGTLLTEYTVGDDADFSGVKLEATLADESKIEIVRSHFTLNDAEIDLETEGTYSLVATYVDAPNNAKPHTTTAIIRVRENIVVDPDEFVTDISINSGTYSPSFTVGDAIPTTGGIAFASMTITIKKASGDTAVVNRNGFSLNISALDMNTAGSYSLVATYVDTLNANKAHTASVIIEVRDVVVPIEDLITGIVRFMPGYQTTYQIGETFSYSGILLEVNIEGGGTAQVGYGVFELNLEAFVDLEGANAGKIKGEVGERDLIATIELDDQTLTKTVKITIVPAYEAIDPDTEIDTIEIIGGTKSQYLEGERFLYRSIVAEITNKGEEKTTVYYPSFAVSAVIKGTTTSVDIDELTDAVGSYMVTISYYDTAFTKYVTDSYEITVVAKPQEIGIEELIYNYDAPNSLNLYKSNIEEKPDNEENEFMVRDRGYTVGTDNKFVFKPKLSKMNDNGLYTSTDPYLNDIKVYVSESGDEYELLDDNNLEQNRRLITYVTVDYNESTFLFKAAARNDNLRFKIVQKPGDTRYLVYETQHNKTFSLENIRVISGYNAHNELELSLMDNSSGVASDGTGSIENIRAMRWYDFKESHGLVQPAKMDAMILHNDMIITKDVIPSQLLHHEAGLVGALRNNVAIYARNSQVAEDIRPGSVDEEFTLFGNYFTIDASKIPLIKTENFASTAPVGSLSFVFSESALFAFGADLNGSIPGYTNKNRVESARFIGNTVRGDNAAYTGGLRLVSGSGVECAVDNIIARAFYQFFRATGSQGGSVTWRAWDKLGDRPEPDEGDVLQEKFLVSNSRCYDSFSNMFDTYDHDNVIMENSEFKRAGGPIIVMGDWKRDNANVWRYDPTNKYFPKVLAKNCTMETWLAGDEVFFAAGDTVGQTSKIKALEAFYGQITQGAKNTSIPQLSSSGTREYANIFAIMTPDALLNVFNNKGRFEMQNCRGAYGREIGGTVLDLDDTIAYSTSTSTAYFPPVEAPTTINVRDAWFGGAPVLQTNGGTGAGRFMLLPVGEDAYPINSSGGILNPQTGPQEIIDFVQGTILSVSVCVDQAGFIGTNAKICLATEFFNITSTSSSSSVRTGFLNAFIN